MEDNELLFSQRIGKTPIQKTMQIESIDGELKAMLCNVFKRLLLDKIPKQYLTPFSETMWHRFFKRDFREMPGIARFQDDLLELIYDPTKEWYETYDLIEVSVKTLIICIKQDYEYSIVNNFVDALNRTLIRENAGYRFINGIFAPITNEFEIKELVEVFSNTKQFTSFKGANTHLSSALKFLSDKENPDYRNSMQESISAVESIAKAMCNQDGGDLSKALNKLTKTIKLHRRLCDGFIAIYNYTSDADGIRHGLKREDEPCYLEDARYMLISCSAFVNYLIFKCKEAGLSIA